MNKIDRTQRVIDLLNSPSWKPIRHFFKFLSFDADEVLLQQGAAAKGLYIVTSGQVELTMSLDSGQQVTVDVMDGFGHFGEVALIDGGKCLVTARTLDHVNVIFLGEPYYQALRVGFPEVALELMSVMSLRAIEKLHKTLDQMFDAIQRSSINIKQHFVVQETTYQDIHSGWLREELKQMKLTSFASMSHMTDDECDLLAEYFEPAFIDQAGLFKQDKYDAIFLLLDGVVQLEHVQDDVCFSFPPMQPGYIFSAERMLSVPPMTTTLRIREPSMFLKFKADRLWNMKTVHHEVYSKLFGVVMYSIASKLRIIYKYLNRVSEEYSIEYDPRIHT